MAPEVPTIPVVDVSADGLRVLVRGEFEPEHLNNTADAIRAQMEALGLCEAALSLDIPQSLSNWLSSGSSRAFLVLYEGQAPGPATHGHLQWARDFFVTGFEVDPDRDVVDYRQRLDERSVAKDELLCTLTDPIDGAPGVDVFGKPIPGPKAKRPKIRVGPNVRSPDEKNFYAACAGRIRWHGGALSVDDVYVVEGSVNLKTGNIKHPGTLVIYKDVERDSVVTAEKNVEIMGMIDGGSVHAGGDIIVRGGIVGHGDSIVSAGGSVRAAYMLDARVCAEGDVFVGREIVQSRVTAHGSIHISQGRIAGGIVHAGVEVVAGEIGTDGAVKTAVHVAEPEKLTAQRRGAEQAVTRADQQHEQIRLVVEKLENRAGNLPADKRAILSKLKEQLKNIQTEREARKQELAGLLARLPQPEARRIRIVRRLHPEPALNVNGHTKNITHGIDGPLTIRFHGDEIHIIAD